MRLVVEIPLFTRFGIHRNGGCLRFLPSIVCINSYGPFTNLPFECRAIYFDSQVHRAPLFNHQKLHEKINPQKLTDSHCPLVFFYGFQPIFLGLKLQVTKRQTWQTPLHWQTIGWLVETPQKLDPAIDTRTRAQKFRATFGRTCSHLGSTGGVESRVDLMEEVAWKPQQKGIRIGIRWHWGSLNISILHFDIVGSYSQGEIV